MMQANAGPAWPTIAAVKCQISATPPCSVTPGQNKMALLELLVKSPAAQTEIDEEVLFPLHDRSLPLTECNISEQRDDETNVCMSINIFKYHQEISVAAVINERDKRSHF